MAWNVSVPMDGLSAADPTRGGLLFCQLTENGRCFHPGVDLNGPHGGDADRYLPERAVLDFEVWSVTRWNGTSTGYGHHVWLRYPFDPTSPTGESYNHYCHQEEIAEGLAVGQAGRSGQQIGRCGKSGLYGGNYTPYAHLHWEVRWTPPPSPDFWPSGYSEAWVRANYVRPRDWWAGLLAYAPEEEIPVDTTPEERAALQPYFEQLGVPVNVETAIMKLAALAYKRGETRGPAMSDEYPATSPEGAPVIRQQFTAGVGQFDPASGATHWVEVVKEAMTP
jgi:murein DD-endopeptidase MepM/ murein hydrolase activator NlpD